MSELERDMQPLAEEIIAAPATSLAGLRAKALVALDSWLIAPHPRSFRYSAPSPPGRFRRQDCRWRSRGLPCMPVALNLHCKGFHPWLQPMRSGRSRRKASNCGEVPAHWLPLESLHGDEPCRLEGASSRCYAPPPLWRLLPTGWRDNQAARGAQHGAAMIAEGLKVVCVQRVDEGHIRKRPPASC